MTQINDLFSKSNTYKYASAATELGGATERQHGHTTAPLREVLLALPGQGD